MALTPEQLAIQRLQERMRDPRWTNNGNGGQTYLDEETNRYYMPQWQGSIGSGGGEPEYQSNVGGFIGYDNLGHESPDDYSHTPVDLYGMDGTFRERGQFPLIHDDSLSDLAKYAAILATVGGAGALAAGGAFGGAGAAGIGGAGAPATFGTTGAIGGIPAATGMGANFTTLGAGLGGAAGASIPGSELLGAHAAASGGGSSGLLGGSAGAGSAGGGGAPATFGTTGGIGGYAPATGTGVDFTTLAATGGPGVSIPGSQLGTSGGGWMDSIRNAVSGGTGGAGGLGSLLGPAATALGGIAGAQGNEQTNGSERRMDPRLDGAVYGENGIVPRTQGLLAQQMTPEAQAGFRQMQAQGMGLLQQPIAGNGFERFANRRLM